MADQSDCSCLSRRLLLGGGVSMGALGAFTGWRPQMQMAMAQEDLPSDRYFVFCYFSGGWDLLLSLDPRHPGTFSPDLKKVTRIETGFELLPSSRRELVETAVPGMTFGPYIGDLAQHASKLCVVRGLSMDTLTHEVGRRRFITGIPPAGLQAQGSSLATILASYLGVNEPIPQLSVKVESYNDHWPTYASAIKVSSVDDLVRALRPSPYDLGRESDAIDALLETFRDCEQARESAYRTAAHEFRVASKDLVSLGLDNAFDFSAETPEMQALRDLYGFEAGENRTAGAQAAAAITALTSGISRTVSVVVAEDLDAHGPEWANSHGDRQEAGFNVMAALISDLESREYKDTGDTWLDHTTVIGFSEFGRTALLNSSGGRDHYLHNAAVLAGAGVKQGAVVGSTTDVGMAPVELNLTTGERDPSGSVINPEHIFRALLEDVGITEDVAEYRAEAFRAVLRS